MDFDETRSLSTPTGATLNLRIRHRDRALGVIHVCHGLAEHSARYARFAAALNRAGLATYAHDHRGHGTTRAPDAPLGRFAATGGASKVVADVDTVQRQIAEEYPGVPLILLGHSMGGIIALNAVMTRSEQLAGAAIWNANFSAGALGRLAQLLLAWERMRLGDDVPSRLLPKLTFQAWGKAVPGHVTPFDWLSRDPVEVRKYIDDPLCGWDASVSLWRDLFEMVFRGARDGSFVAVRRDLPFSLVGGGADPATDKGVAVKTLSRRMTAMGFSNLETRIYAETRHESLNELNRDIITADFIAWAASVAAAG